MANIHGDEAVGRELLLGLARWSKQGTSSQYQYCYFDLVILIEGVVAAVSLFVSSTNSLQIVRRQCCLVGRKETVVHYLVSLRTKLKMQSKYINFIINDYDDPNSLDSLISYHISDMCTPDSPGAPAPRSACSEPSATFFGLLISPPLQSLPITDRSHIVVLPTLLCTLKLCCTGLRTAFACFPASWREEGRS